MQVNKVVNRDNRSNWNVNVLYYSLKTTVDAVGDIDKEEQT